MCRGVDAGDFEVVQIRGKDVKIDKCLKEFIVSLNKFGIITTGCCCGHVNTEAEGNYRNVKYFNFKLSSKMILSTNNEGKISIYDKAGMMGRDEVTSRLLTDICLVIDEEGSKKLFSCNTEEEAVEGFKELYKMKKGGK